MIDFIVQQDKHTGLEVDELILMKQLDSNPYMRYQRQSLREMRESVELGNGKIPVGTIEFVEEYLLKSSGNKINGYEHENPIEIPKYLRTEEFLKRDYEIMRGDRIVLAGHKFIKNVSTLKQGAYMGELAYYEQSMGVKPLSNELYQISSDFNPVAEYRVYVFNSEIESIAYYDGSYDGYSLFPDIKLLNKAVNLIMLHEKWLKSYTIDVMINKRGETAIVEIHNFASVGLYTTVFSSYLPYAYMDGINYLLNDNKQLEV